jgi:hypothetical protein
VAHKAGQNIRKLARGRRGDALSHFAGAGFLVILIVPLHFFLAVVLGSSGLAVLVSVACGIGAIALGRQGMWHWWRANRADQGARGEEQVSQTLASLREEGWTVQYNPELRWGDADAFLRSPLGNHYVIDVKAHTGGTVFFDSQTKMLMRRYGRDTVHDFGKNSRGESKDLLRAVKGQAAELRQQQKVRWVTPLLCFTQADIEPSVLPEQPVEGVYIVKLPLLTWLLRRLDTLERR